MSITHKIRLDIIRDNTIVDSLDNPDNLKISTNSSVHSFPILSFNSSNDELNKAFMSYSKLDIMRLSVSHSNDNQYNTMFEGEFLKKNIHFESEPNMLILEVEAIHSFFRLSLLEISTVQKFNEINFEDFVLNLAEMAGIKSKIYIADNLKNIVITGLSRNTNAFRLFKEVCLILNTTVVFNPDNTVHIESRTERVNSIRASVPKIITDKEIISFNTTEQI